ncbi:MAG: class I SAM-dependent methyltransferase [bacterium]
MKENIIQNKNHWYDGWFYDKLIAPNQDKSFSILKSFVEENSTLLDVGCGTGRLAFQIADKCKKVIAIDLSSKNIEVAKRNLAANPASNIEFLHADIDSLLTKNEMKFNYSVLSYVIHEVDEEDREGILTSLIKISDKIILIDYLVPRPKTIWNFINEIVEFLAGKNHYMNFKSYVRNNGIAGLAEQTGLRITKQIKNCPGTTHFVVLTK